MNYQSEIVAYLRTVESATLEEIYNNISANYMHNYKKHTGNLMNRLVRIGKVKRIKRGVFKLNDESKPINTGLFYGEEK
jgi:hypothetical protein